MPIDCVRLSATCVRGLYRARRPFVVSYVFSVVCSTPRPRRAFLPSRGEYLSMIYEVCFALHADSAPCGSLPLLSGRAAAASAACAAAHSFAIASRSRRGAVPFPRGCNTYNMLQHVQCCNTEERVAPFKCGLVGLQARQQKS